MKDLVKKFQTDSAEKERFIAYMHEQEKVIQAGSAVLADKLNSLYMQSLKEFCEKEGVQLTDDEETKQQCIKVCRAVADNMQNNVIDQFARAFA